MHANEEVYVSLTAYLGQFSILRQSLHGFALVFSWPWVQLWAWTQGEEIGLVGKRDLSSFGIPRPRTPCTAAWDSASASSVLGRK